MEKSMEPKYESISEIYQALINDEANFFDLHDFVCKRQNDSWARGYEAAVAIMNGEGAC